MKPDLDTLERLAALMEEKELSSLDIAEGDVHISLTRREPSPAAGSAVPALAPPAASEEEEQPVDFDGMREWKSPMVGVVYTAAEPGMEPFVRPGSRVKKGDVLCIIEAMKLMNEYTAPEDGEIADICFENEELVEYGQVLFKVV